MAMASIKFTKYLEADKSTVNRISPLLLYGSRDRNMKKKNKVFIKKDFEETFLGKLIIYNSILLFGLLVSYLLFR